MNRTIKFRAWDKLQEVMSYNPNFMFENGRPQIDEGNPWELMQYIGLKDKNGKEIYEADILACRLMLNDSYTSEYPVIFEKGAFTINGYPIPHYYEVEVIGNAYEN